MSKAGSFFREILHNFLGPSQFEKKIGESDEEGIDTRSSVHPEFQRLSCRCVSCQTKVYSHVNENGTECLSMSSSVDSITESGGVVSCGECSVSHGDYCVHGLLYEEDCPYCPEGSRIDNLGQYKRRSE